MRARQGIQGVPRTRECARCGEILPISRFYRAKGARDGYMRICKGCKSRAVVASRDNARANARDKARNARDPHFAAKARARALASAAVERGDLKRPGTCEGENCGCRGPLDSHHDDYGKPLEVRWLCAKCHKRVHMTRVLVGLVLVPKVRRGRKRKVNQLALL